MYNDQDMRNLRDILNAKITGWKTVAWLAITICILQAIASFIS